MLTLGQAAELAERHVRHKYVECAGEYGEPGYNNPKGGILFADWNDCPQWLIDGLERRGFSLEWSDEWLVASETFKAYRSSPDSYGWTPYYIMNDDGDIIGGDEIESGDMVEWYINEYLLNDPTRANLFHKLDLEKHGFKQYNGRFETGFHPGQNDNPRETFKRIKAEMPDYDVVFSIDSKGQFDTYWSAWVRPNRTN